MRRGLLLSGVACVVLFISLHAGAKPSPLPEEGYQAATIVSVTKHVSDSNYVGDNPSDAPLQARDYSYDIGILVNCRVYVGRYESPTRYLPSVFAPNHEVDVRLRKRILFVSLPFSDDEVRMGIVGHKRVKNEVCVEFAPKPSAGQISQHQLTQNNFKGGLL